jgi:3-deoxy-D-manno-octulosonic-acid transferase
MEPSNGAHAIRVAFVALGWGQMRLMKQLSSALCEARPHAHVTWTFFKSATVRSLPETMPQQPATFLPFDFLIPVLNWLRHIDPDVVVFVERVGHPNLVRSAVDWGATVILANGFRQPHATRRRRLLAPLRRWTLAGFDSLCFQNNEYLDQIRHVLPPDAKTRITGNVKFDCRPLHDLEKEKSLARWFSIDESTRHMSTPLLAAGSTGPVDEVFVLEALEMVRKETPCALLLAPRRMGRVEEVLVSVQSRNLKVSRRSSPPEESWFDADVYLLDTMGELALAYQFAQAAFIGGTLEGGGHDVIEPLVWGVPVFYGPGKGKKAKANLGSGKRECEAAGVGFVVHTPAELASQWLKMLRDEGLRRTIKTNAALLLEEQGGTLERNVAAIVELVDEVERSKAIQ